MSEIHGGVFKSWWGRLEWLYSVGEHMLVAMREPRRGCLSDEAV